MAMNSESVSRNVREYRIGHSMTQQQMADRLGITREAYSRIENGITKLISDYIFRISEILDVSPQDLIMGEDAPSRDGLLMEARGEMEDRLIHMSNEYERKLEARDTEIASLRELCDTQKETIATQKEIISMLKRRIPEEND